MVAHIYDSTGSAIESLVINEIKEDKIVRSVIIDLPIANKDFLQSMGLKNRNYTISGWGITSGSSYDFSQPAIIFDTSEFDYGIFSDFSGVSFSLVQAREALFSLIGSSGSIVSDIMPMTPVLFTDLTIDDKGGRPFEFKFELSAIEII